MNVTVYTTTTCPYCKMLKDHLTERGINFIEKVIDVDDPARETMLAESGGFMGVPFTIIENEDGSKETIIGFDKGKIEKVFATAQNTQAVVPTVI